MFKKVIYIFIMLTSWNSVLLNGQGYLEREDQWVSSVMSNMSIDHKIGQIFMIRTYSRGNVGEENAISDLILKYNIGGICFFQGSPLEQVSLINKYQQKSRIPLFMGIDGEWGLGMRFPKETISFPHQLMLGAVQNNALIYDMGREIAKQCKKAGININFAPSLDINNNPDNPVIYDRSFGESPLNVTEKGYMFMKAMEDEGIMACIKHFPGHGDTNVDSHDDLPQLSHSRERLEQTEFYPFRRLASQGVSGLMVGHLRVPTLDDRINRPTTLSEKVVKNIIRDDMGYNGLIFTDAMDMKSITKYYPNGIAEAEAFLAGNDVILLPENLSKAIDAIKDYMNAGKISEQRLNESVERILRAKYKLGLNTIPNHNAEGMIKYLNRNHALAIKQKLIEASITLVSDNSDIIPFRNTEGLNFGTLSINVNHKTPFQDRVDDYVNARHYQLMPQQMKIKYNDLLQSLTQFDRILISIHTSGKLNDFTRDLPDDVIKFLNEINHKDNVVIVLFGSPYLLKKIPDMDNVLLCYDNDLMTQDISAQALFGVSTLNGKLPVTINGKWPNGHGLVRESLGRLGYSLPERVNLSSDSLMLIDSVMNQMIQLNAAPGGQVLIAKDGKIVFEKAYGKLSPDGYYVSKNTIYDIASITKILATTISTMKLVDDRKINITDPINKYIAGIDTTDKALLKIEDIMAHHSRLMAYIPFFEKTTLPKKSFGYNPQYYSGMLQENYTIPVARGMFMRTDYRDTIWHAIWTSKLRDNDGYKYSDLGLDIIQKVIENQAGKKLDEYAMTNFYKPLGLKYTTFRPLEKHPAFNIAPSEVDNYFRLQTLQGNVHDMAAAMMGGVSGHAGLFSNAHDMAVIMQMLLNKGSYGGTRYIKAETVKLFTTRFRKSTRRGIGFDMKELDLSKIKNMSSLAPSSTFGHTGFTGTAVFADPENNIIFVFCANRTYSSANSSLFNNREYRPRIQSIIYKAMKGYLANAYL
ncbi:MAG: serine hydrolase [Saprospiraceae bacterium]|nr:serine hydrolase [Saprospiraceae bacterium]